jgi:hypothetical protein
VSQQQRGDGVVGFHSSLTSPSRCLTEFSDTL